MRDVVVIGGGISGLACAGGLLEADPRMDLILLEAEDRVGGNIHTTREDGFTVEWGVNGFLDNVPETLEAVGRVGLREALTPARDAASRRFIFRGGRLREIPLKPGPFLASDLLSLRGRLRILGEPFARRSPGGDETVFAFAARRIGAEAAEILVDSMVSGVYAGDARSLSLASTFPKMAEMEREHGSLVRAMIARKREGRLSKRGGGPAGPGGVLTSFREGMVMLTDRLAERLTPARILLRHPVEAVARHGAGYRVTAGGDAIDARKIIVAAPARHAGDFLKSLDAELAAELSGIGYAGLAVVALAYRDEDLAGGPPDGFGFLSPRGQGLRILGCLWDSSIFPRRAPRGWALLRAMIGGAQDPGALRLGDGALLAQVEADLRASMGIEIPPRRSWIFRHPLGIPQYTVGHAARLDRIAARLAALPGVTLTGNSYRGVAVNSCLKEAGELVARWSEPPREGITLAPSALLG